MTEAPVPGQDRDRPRPLLWMPWGEATLGGHQSQLNKTAEALRSIGVHVSVSTDPRPALDGIDIVHGFGLVEEQVRWCRTEGVPVVISTIYWDRTYRADGPAAAPTARAVLGRAYRAGRLARASMRGRGELVRVCLEEVAEETMRIAAYSTADLLLPNSTGEGDAIKADLAVTTPIRVVPNAVDPHAFSPGTAPFAERSSVLFVGRIEPHKNQLGLIEALAGTGLPLVIAGFPHPDHLAYGDKCRRRADASVRFVGSPDDGDLAGLYQSARVHVLPSWFETTGLVSLEAALSGCSIVTTSRGYAPEYFGDLAAYCDPADPPSIRRAVEQAWATPPKPELRERVLHHYTWAHTARATLAAYHEVLTRRTAVRTGP